MSEALEPVIEEDTTNDNEEAPEKVEEPKPEETPKETTQEKTKEEPPKEDEQFKNKADRMKNKKVKCEGCQAEMTLKTLRYSHKCNGTTEDKPIKPKPKARTVAVKPIENQIIKTIPPTGMKEAVSYSEHEVSCSSATLHEPVEVKTKAKAVKMSEPEPPRQLTARESLEASYAEIRRAEREAHIEKTNGFKSKML